MPKRIKPEAAVQRAVLDLLAAEHVFAIRLNTIAIRTENGRPIFSHSGGAGVADIVAFPVLLCHCKEWWYPRPLWIECKSAQGRQFQEQLEFQNKVIGNDHFYIVARSSDDVLAWLRVHPRFRSL